MIAARDVARHEPRVFLHVADRELARRKSRETQAQGGSGGSAGGEGHVSA
jgi:hypothetical protein